MVAIYNAVRLGRPADAARIFTVTGDAVVKPGNFLYSIGTNYAELVDAAGGLKEQPEKIISGGPMMGFSMFSLDIPTTKTSSSLLCLTKDEVAAVETKSMYQLWTLCGSMSRAADPVKTCQVCRSRTFR